MCVCVCVCSLLEAEVEDLLIISITLKLTGEDFAFLLVIKLHNPSEMNVGGILLNL